MRKGKTAEKLFIRVFTPNQTINGPNSKNLQMTNFDKMIISVFDRVENIVGKGDTGFQHFSFSHSVFKRFLSQGGSKTRLCGTDL